MASIYALQDEVNKQHGDKVMGSGGLIVQVDRIPTGIFAFDLISGGGIPRNRLIEIYGAPSACKSNLAQKIVASQQQLEPDMVCAWIAVEQFDPIWAKKFGVDVNKLMVVNPNYSEQIIDISEGLMEADDCGLVVLNSFAAMTTQREVEQSAEKQDPGGSGLIGKKLCNKIVRAQRNAEMNKGHFPTFIIINQIRHKIGVLYGSPETTPGGFSPEFMSAMRIRLYAKNIVDKKVNANLPCRKEIHVEIKKNKVPIVATECVFEMALIPHTGLKIGQVDNWSTLWDYLKKHQLVLPLEKSKGWKLGAEHFPTIIAVRERIMKDPDMYAALTKAIIDAEVSAVYDSVNQVS